jgi:hypothetical protein
MPSKFAAPNTLVAISLLAVLGAACTALFRPPLGDRLRAKVVKAATNYLSIPPPDWYGAFALWTLHQAGLALNVLMKDGSEFTENLPKTLVPKVGDVAKTSISGHGIVKSVNADGTVSIVNRNVTGGVTTISNLKKSDVIAFYSIQPFIDKVTS